MKIYPPKKQGISISLTTFLVDVKRFYEIEFKIYGLKVGECVNSAM